MHTWHLLLQLAMQNANFHCCPVDSCLCTAFPNPAGLGARLVIVCGAKPQIDAYVRAHGQQPRLVGAYRVTDGLALQGALQASGSITTAIAAHLSKVWIACQLLPCMVEGALSLCGCVRVLAS